MAVRERLLPENGRISQIAMSAMEDWGGEIKESDAPVLVIIEGLTMYLSEADICSDCRAVCQGGGIRGGDEPHGRKTVPGEVHREQPCKIYVGDKGWQSICRAFAGFPVCGGAQPGGGHGGISAGLPMAGKNSACSQYFQQNPCAGEVIAGIP